MQKQIHTNQSTQNPTQSKQKKPQTYFENSATKMLSLILQIKNSHLCSQPLPSQHSSLCAMCLSEDTSASEEQSFSESFPKVNQSHLVQTPATSINLFASLPVVPKHFGWYQEVRRKECRKGRGKKRKWTVSSILYTCMSTKMSFCNHSF